MSFASVCGKHDDISVTKVLLPMRREHRVSQILGTQKTHVGFPFPLTSSPWLHFRPGIFQGPSGGVRSTQDHVHVLPTHGWKGASLTPSRPHESIWLVTSRQETVAAERGDGTRGPERAASAPCGPGSRAVSASSMWPAERLSLQSHEGVS